MSVGSTFAHFRADDCFRLNRLLGDVVISQGGVVPHIAAVRHFPSSSIHVLIIRVQELLPSKSRFARFLAYASSVTDPLCCQQRKEGGGRGLISSFPAIYFPYYFLFCIFYHGILYTILGLLLHPFCRCSELPNSQFAFC